MTIPIGDVDATELLDFSADGGTLYLRDSRGRDKAVLFAAWTWQAANRPCSRLTTTPTSARSPLSIARRWRRWPMPGRARWHPVESNAAADLTALAAYGDGDIYFPDFDQQGDKGIVYIERDTRAANIVLLDTATAAMKPLYMQRKALTRSACGRWNR